VTSRTRAWRDGGDMVAAGGRSIFVRVEGGAGPPLVFLHGYPSSSYDWRLLLALLPGRHTVAFDFLGFGLSDKPREHVYSLLGQADLAEELIGRLAGPEIVLVAHDMGTSVATELLARDIEGRLGFRLRAVLLLNGSMVLERASLTISQKLLRGPLGPLAARLSSERAFRAQFRRIFSPRHPVGRDELADQWSLLAHRGGHRILDRLTYYLSERIAYAERWHGALRDWPGRLELAWGMRDPVSTPAVLEAVRDLRPEAPFEPLAELGHYPQIEDPGALAPIVERVAG
jgi:pimeloyl-ACP methyl ester carboxylesterase